MKVGTIAPDFEVPLGTGGSFRLSDYRGENVVIFFYPRAFSLGCTAEVSGFCDVHDEILAQNAVLIGISPDGLEKVENFGQSVSAPFGLGSDTSGQIRKAYGVQRRFGLGTSRVTYVIDPDGIIRGVFHNEFLMGSHARNVLSTLAELADAASP